MREYVSWVLQLSQWYIGLQCSSKISTLFIIFLAYADDVNLIGDDIRTIERNADVLLNSCKDIRLAVNTGKTKYMEIGFIEAWMQAKGIWKQDPEANIWAQEG